MCELCNSLHEKDRKKMYQTAIRQMLDKSASALGSTTASPWPAKDVVLKLVEATNILLDEKNYDGHGYEEMCAAKDAALKWLKS